MSLAVSLCLGTTGLTGFCLQAQAMQIVPFNTRNQSPLIAIYGLPPAGEARVLPKGRFQTTFSADIANNFVIDQNARESILLDGETYRFNLALRSAITDRFEIGIEVPYVCHEGGFLDSFIEGWHAFFGLPNGGRDQNPRNRLTYRYIKGGQQKIDLSQSASGLGDIRLLGAWQLYRRGGDSRGAVALRGSLKLPTGGSSRLLGSGSTDLAFWLTGEKAASTRRGPIAAFGAAGLLLMTKGQVLPEQHRQLVGFATLGAGWRPLDWLAFKVQLDGHTPFYGGSELKEINGSSVQLTMGGTLGVARNTSLDIGVCEDIVVNTSPDVVFHFALRTLF